MKNPLLNPTPNSDSPTLIYPLPASGEDQNSLNAYLFHHGETYTRFLTPGRETPFKLPYQSVVIRTSERISRIYGESLGGSGVEYKVTALPVFSVIFPTPEEWKEGEIWLDDCDWGSLVPVMEEDLLVTGIPNLIRRSPRRAQRLKQFLLLDPLFEGQDIDPRLLNSLRTVQLPSLFEDQ